MAQLFQLQDAEELDFGFYRIIKRHNRKVRDFLGEIDPQSGELKGGELAGLLSAAFQRLEYDDTREKKHALQDLGKKLGIAPHLDDASLTAKLAELESIPQLQPQVAAYRELRAELYDTHSAHEDRAEVLNRLYEFYTRHYQNGDFIVQRRYGKNGARYIKSTGDDTEFRWATEDMYYIKSGDVFTDYPFVLPNGRRMVFSLDADSVQRTRAELKPTDRAHYARKGISKHSDGVQGELRVELFYRKGAQKKTQLDDIAQAAATSADVPVEQVARHLRRFIARNQADFFIHKRLREALDEDLDIFLKAEVLNVDQLLAEDATAVAGRALRVARITRLLARRINAFLGVLEDHQKRLWKKKKLVLDTRYVITLDRLERDAGDWLAANIERIVIVQRNEWEALGLGEYASVAACKQAVAGNLVSDASERYLPLPLDTGLFDDNFKWSLLAAVTASKPLDEALDGVAIHSDNWQALNTLQEKYLNRVKCIYIDPPYNTGGDGFPYKDAYQHASWLAMIRDRLHISEVLLQRNGVLFSSIDQNEYPKLRTLLEAKFGSSNALGTIVWKNVTDNNPTNIAVEHEYVEAFAKNRSMLESEWKSPYSDAKELLVNLGRELIAKHGNTADLQNAYKDWFKENRTFLGPLDRYKYIDAGGIFTGSQSVHNPGKEGYRYDILHPKTGKPCKQPLMGYRFPEETYQRLLSEGRILFGDAETKLIELKVYAHEYEAKLSSIIELDGRSGANDLTNLFGTAQLFKNPKASALLQEILPFAAGQGDLILDFFAGSGTTTHAITRLNAKAKLGLRWLCVEASHNFEALIVPRLKKVAFSPDWLKGKPVERNGPGTFVRVQRLEQYEDALENLALEQHESANLFDEAEALAYELDDTLEYISLNGERFACPAGATLKRIEGASITAQPVDLVESLAYLLGLHIDRLYREDGSVVMTGCRNGSGETVMVLWRDNVLHGEPWIQAKLAAHPADRIYTNEPGLLAFEGAERFLAIESVFVEGLSGRVGDTW